MPAPDSEALIVALEAKAIAEDALAKADAAVSVAEGAKAAVAGFGHDVRRCTNEVADLKQQSAAHHDETMKAIAGAKETDAKQAADIADARKSLAEAQAAVDQGKKDLAAVKGDISSTALMKIAGAFVGVLAAAGGLLAALIPYVGRIVEAKYPPAPTVVVQTAPAPSAAPALSR